MSQVGLASRLSQQSGTTSTLLSSPGVITCRVLACCPEARSRRSRYSGLVVGFSQQMQQLQTRCSVWRLLSGLVQLSMESYHVGVPENAFSAERSRPVGGVGSVSLQVLAVLANQIRSQRRPHSQLFLKSLSFRDRSNPDLILPNRTPVRQALLVCGIYTLVPVDLWESASSSFRFWHFREI